MTKASHVLSHILVGSNSSSTTLVVSPESAAATEVRFSIYDWARTCGRSQWAARCMEQEIVNRMDVGKRVVTQLRRLGIRW